MRGTIIPDKLEVREAREEDLKDIINIYYANSMELLGLTTVEPMLRYDRVEYGERYAFLSLENLRRWFRDRGNGSYVFVACLGGVLVGFIVFHYVTCDGGIGYVEELHVARGYRGLGVGSALLKEAEKVLRSRGAKLVYLEANVRSLEFFYRVGYVPINIEPRPYMGRLQYVDMVKVLGSNMAMMLYEGVLARFREGEYRDALLKLKKLIKLLEPLKGLGCWNLLKFLELVIEAHIEDEETQSYVPLYKRIMDRVERDKTLGFYRDLLRALANRILVEGTSEVGLVDESIQISLKSLELLSDFISKLKQRELASLRGLAFMYEYSYELGAWFNSILAIMTRISRPSKGSFDFYVDAGRLYFSEFRSEIQDHLSLLGRVREGIYVYNGTVKYSTFLTVFIHLGVSNIKEVKEKLIEYLREIGANVKEEEGLTLSKDIAPPHLRELARDSIVINVDNIEIGLDLPDLRWQCKIPLDIIFMPGGVVAIIAKISGEDNTWRIHFLSRLLLPSSLEHYVKIGEHYVRAEELAEVKGNYASLWYAVVRILREIRRRGRWGKGTYHESRIEEDEDPITHAIVIIEANNDSVNDILQDVYIRRLIAGYETTSRTLTTGTHDKLEERNIASLIDYPEDFLSITPSRTVLVASAMPLWVRRELTWIIMLLQTQEKILRYSYKELQTLVRKISSHGTSRSYDDVAEVKKIATSIQNVYISILSHLHFLTSPQPTRYTEYNMFIKKAIESLGLLNTYNKIENLIKDVLRILEFLETRTLRELLEEEKRGREVIEYVTLVISVVGLGEIIWSLIRVVNPNALPLLKIGVYLILLVIGLLFIRLSRH